MANSAARRRAASEAAFQRLRSSSRATAPPASASTSPTGPRKPETPCSTTSGSPPALVPTTGTPVASASRAESPKDSTSLGSRYRSAHRSACATSSTLPRNRTRDAIPSASASRSASGRSGPSPTSTSRDGIRSRTFAKIRTTSWRCFTGRMLEMCISVFSSACSPQVPGSRGWNSARSTKFGITSISQVVQPKAR